ncbi:MAG TPA: hypothetical protein DCG20_07965 [Prevotella sp.]|nr:hypothetical protein [Prevotella sp.]
MIATAETQFLPPQMQSLTLQRYAFFLNPTRFSLFFERRRAGKGPSYFVNEGKHASGLEVK